MAGVFLGLAAASGAGAQDVPGDPGNGSTGDAIGGALLGAYSVGVLSAASSLIPCRQLGGRGCVLGVTIGGSALGLTAGFLYGDGRGELGPVLRGIGLGSIAGGVVGLAAHLLANEWSWLDVLALTMAGGAYGAAPIGATVGALAGGTIGVVLWKGTKTIGVANALGAGLVGMAIGSAVEWFVRAADAQSSSRLEMHVTIPLGGGR